MQNRYVLTVALNAAVDTTYVFDGFETGEIQTVAEMSRVAGGKANNVARVLRSLGIPVMATGFAGGRAGDFIQEQLRSLGIGAEYEEIPGESRTCYALVDRKNGKLTEIREKGPAIQQAQTDAFIARFQRLLEKALHVVISGSLPPGVPTDFYARLVSLARQRGIFTVLDTSGKALTEALAAGPSLVKPNRDELAAWIGSPIADLAGVRAAAEAMHQAGPRAVAVSLGAQGLLFLGPEGSWQLKPPAVQAVNTVGSGDSLVAGLVAGLSQDLPLPEALALGVAAGTANALTDAVASPDPAEIARIRLQVAVEKQ